MSGFLNSESLTESSDCVHLENSLCINSSMSIKVLYLFHSVWSLLPCAPTLYLNPAMNPIRTEQEKSLRNSVGRDISPFQF